MLLARKRRENSISKDINFNNKSGFSDLIVQGNESLMASIDSPVKAREFSFLNHNKIKKLTEPLTEANTNHSHYQMPSLTENSLFELNPEQRPKLKNSKYPMSHLLEAGLLILKINKQDTLFNYYK